MRVILFREVVEAVAIREDEAKTPGCSAYISSSSDFAEGNGLLLVFAHHSQVTVGS
jgi:hypothetical protein